MESYSNSRNNSETKKSKEEDNYVSRSPDQKNQLNQKHLQQVTL